MANQDDVAPGSIQGVKPSKPGQSGPAEPDWETEYNQLIESLRSSIENAPGKGSQKPGGMSQERRSEPRYAFKEGSQVFAHLGPKAFQIINISIGGVAFFSDIYFDGGTKLLLSALGMIALDVEVLSCEMEEIDEGMMEYRYRVRAKFGPRVNGYQVYVLAREMYLQQTGEGAPPTLNASAPEE